ncbi:MAG TPA: phospholipase A [Polyangia bacterium]|nr:phospholipase A [Polyangia bacterium]
MLDLARVVVALIVATADEPSPAQTTPAQAAPIVRAPGAPPKTAIDEPVAPSDDAQYFFLHEENYFAFQANGGWPARTKFQVSLRFDMLTFRETWAWGLSAAYTQKSFWDMLDFDHSSPFVESNYKPEAFVFLRRRRHERFREAQLGIQHESNGLGDIGGVNQTVNSRGWNAIFLEGRWGIARERASEAWLFFTPGFRLNAPFDVSPELSDRVARAAAFVDVDLRIPNLSIARLTGRFKVATHDLSGHGFNFEADLNSPLLTLLCRRNVSAWIYVQYFDGQMERLLAGGEHDRHVYVGISFE